MNLSSKEISTMMNITTRSVELARHRLRKKLKLDRDQNLVEYLMGLDNK
jgi:DNA-binding CsgD family transcriptional regulator